VFYNNQRCFCFSEESQDPDAFEGDMILTAEQNAAAIRGGDVDASMGRGSIRNKRWQCRSSLSQNPVPIGKWIRGVLEIGSTINLLPPQPISFPDP